MPPPAWPRHASTPRRPLVTPLPPRCCAHAARSQRRHLAIKAGPKGIRWTERGPGRPPFGQASGQASVLPLVSEPYTDSSGKILTPIQAAAAVRELLESEGTALAGLRGSGLAFRQPTDVPTAAAVDELRERAREKLLARLEIAQPPDDSSAGALADSLDPGQLGVFQIHPLAHVNVLSFSIRLPATQKASLTRALTPAAIRQRLIRLAAALGQGLVEREAEVKLLLLALLCAQHALLCGAPGSGKSILGRRLSQAVAAEHTCSDGTDTDGGV